MPWGIGDDKFAFFGREIAIGHVDGDALFALGLQAVHQQRQIELLALGADAFAVAVQRRQLILVDLAGIVQQATDQGAFAVVDAAAGQKAQQALVLLRVRVGFDAALVSDLLCDCVVHPAAP